eukprot:6019406-Pyramimonas_sp.AAC.3
MLVLFIWDNVNLGLCPMQGVHSDVVMGMGEVDVSELGTMNKMVAAMFRFRNRNRLLLDVQVSCSD